MNNTDLVNTEIQCPTHEAVRKVRREAAPGSTSLQITCLLTCWYPKETEKSGRPDAKHIAAMSKTRGSPLST